MPDPNEGPQARYTEQLEAEIVALRAVAEARTVAWSCDADYCAPWPSAEQVAR